MPNPSGAHVCVLCNSKLESKEALQDHFRKHANKEIDSRGRPRKPDDENKPNCSKKIKVEEKVVPDGKKPVDLISCDVCTQKFESVTVAIQHKFRKHPDSAIKHFCPHCGQQFPLKYNRDKHVLSHPDVKPSKMWPCEACGVSFYNAEAHNYHFKSTHKRIVAFFKPVATPPPSKKIRVNNAGEAQSVYYCHLCGFEYIVKFNLQKHLEKQHPEQERNAVPQDLIKCTTCDALFYNKKAYENHNMYHRPDDLYVTSEQQRLQTVTRVDQDFDIRRVQPVAEKYIPVYKPRPRPRIECNMKKRKNCAKKPMGRRKKPADDDESSEMSEPSASSTDSDSDTPLIKRFSGKKRSMKKQKTKQASDSPDSEAGSSSKTDEKDQEPSLASVQNDDLIKKCEENYCYVKLSKVDFSIPDTDSSNSSDTASIHRVKTESDTSTLEEVDSSQSSEIRNACSEFASDGKEVSW